METNILYSNFVDESRSSCPPHTLCEEALLADKDQLSGIAQMSATSSTSETPQGSEDMMSNPVGILQEKCSRFGTPVYSLVHSEGESHAPTFSIQVVVGSRKAVGNGNSKKCAKHAAAVAMLDLFANDKSVDPTTSDTSLPQMGSNKTVGNSIGNLSELCVKKGMQLPRFQLDRIVGQSHNPQFHIVCELGEFREIGVAGSKKDAKREAAQKMMITLTAMQIL